MSRVGPRLLAISSEGKSSLAHLEHLIELAPVGSLAVLLREKTAGLAANRRWLQALLPQCRRREQLLLVSDLPELVEDGFADGVHLSRTYQGVQQLRARWGASRWISQGASFALRETETRGLEAGVQLSPEQAALTAVLLSPVWEARKGRAALGIERFAEIVAQRGEQTPLFFALGGATAERALAAPRGVPLRCAALGSIRTPEERIAWRNWLESPG